MKKLYTFEILLQTEKDLFWKKQDIKMISVNKMYTGNKSKSGRWKSITYETIAYKNFLINKVDDFLLKNPNIPKNIDYPIFYSIQFDLKTKKRKDWEIDQTAISDVDWYIKPIQDSFESDSKMWIQRLWKNDKYIKWFFSMVEYDRFDYSKITINVFEFDESMKEIKKLLNLK